MSDQINAVLERLDMLQYDVAKLEERMSSLENELRLMTHEQGPQLAEIRQELMQMKQIVDGVSEFMEGGKPIEALQAPPRR